jgi:hypothetical protein
MHALKKVNIFSDNKHSNVDPEFRSAMLKPLIDKLARKLSFWKECLMSQQRRAAYVQMVMTFSVVIYLFMAASSYQ